MTDIKEALNAFREVNKSVRVNLTVLEQEIFESGFRAARIEASNLAFESGNNDLAKAIVRLRANES